MSHVKTKKSPTSDERWGFLGLINGGAAHPFKLAFGGEGNGPVTPGGCGSELLRERHGFDCCCQHSC